MSRQASPFTPLAGRYAGVLREDPCRAWGLVDGIEGERFQVQAGLLAICKVNPSPRDVQ